jgi:hypothetical protein
VASLVLGSFLLSYMLLWKLIWLLLSCTERSRTQTLALLTPFQIDARILTSCNEDNCNVLFCHTHLPALCAAMLMQLYYCWLLAHLSHSSGTSGSCSSSWMPTTKMLLLAATMPAWQGLAAGATATLLEQQAEPEGKLFTVLQCL